MYYPVQTEWKQRAYDQKWVLWGMIIDPNETEDDREWRHANPLVSQTPYIWVPMKVVDYLVELE